MNEIELSEKDVERFWSKVDKTPCDPGCWMWTDAPNKQGYGVLSINNKRLRAHRIAWVLANGPIPDGLLVLHRCDNRICVNSAHHFLGTHADNSQDMAQKGRGRTGNKFGSRNPAAILNEKSVREIRLDAIQGLSLGQLTAKYKVSRRTIQSVVYYEKWNHVDLDIKEAVKASRKRVKA